MLTARQAQHDAEAAPALARDAPSASHRVAPEVVLDLSRLLSRMLHPSPTGVDRVEMAYARTLLRRIPERLLFGAVHPLQRTYGRLPRANVERFLDATEARWSFQGDFETRRQAWAFALSACWSLRPRPVVCASRARVLLQASPSHLDRPAWVAAKLMRERAFFVPLIHDLIPLSHPEFARPGGADRHHRRLLTIRDHADAVLANSQTTAASFAAWQSGHCEQLPVRVAPLGVPTAPRTTERTPWSDETYFLCIGTVEPRKNHLLLLNIWRSLVAALGPAASPKLLIVGRRGWENENVVDMLERSPLGGAVVELSRLPDAALPALLRDARALLMPSFAEGFGLPIAEALAAGVPVIASDLPAHREAGGGVPDYLDPLDGLGWRDAILAYAARSSLVREAQLARLANWQRPQWERHIDAALSLVEEIASC